MYRGLCRLQYGTQQVSLGGEVHANVTQQVLLAPCTKQAVGTGKFLGPSVVGLEVSFDVAAHGGLVRAVWARVRLFPCVLA